MKTFVFITLLFASNLYASTKEYTLTIDYGAIEVQEQSNIGMLVNNSYPAPVLYFDEGDIAKIIVKNNMDQYTSIHWHGLLVPPEEDGVPYLSNFPIPPLGEYVYNFPIKHAGTYWYHSHTDLQEQLGVHGGIIIRPKKETIKSDYEAVLVLQDWTKEAPEQVLANLKKDGDYYALKKDSVLSILGYFKSGNIKNWIEGRWMRMGGMDLSDVGYDAFLINGKRTQDILANVSPGEKVRLRLVNSGTSSYFYVHAAPELDLVVISADGNDVQPFTTHEILQAPAETYDLLVIIPSKGRFEIRSSAQDGTGFASVFVGQGETFYADSKKRPDLYSAQMDHAPMSEGQHKKMSQHMGHDMAHNMAHDVVHNMAGTGHNKKWNYAKLKSITPSTLPDAEVREIELRLTGSMEGYNWSFDNVPLSKADKIKINRGEVVRFVFKNETMMHHPLHLHGHFFRVLSGNGQYDPLKHTVDVRPMESLTIEFYANERKDWFFHCHNLYHAKTGMARVVSYGDPLDPALQAAKKKSSDIGDSDFYYSGQAKVLNDYGRIEANYFNRDHLFSLEIDTYDYKETFYEFDYSLSLSKWAKAFIGIEGHEGDSLSRLGVSYVFPLLIEADFYLTEAGDVEVNFETEFQISKRIQSHLEYSTEHSYHYGLEYRLSNPLSLEVSYSNSVEYSAGVKLRF